MQLNVRWSIAALMPLIALKSFFRCSSVLIVYLGDFPDYSFLIVLHIGKYSFSLFFAFPPQQAEEHLDVKALMLGELHRC